MTLILDTKKIKNELQLGDNQKVHAFFTNTCALHMDKYVPFDTGALAETIVYDGYVIPDNVTESTITYNQDYASYVYYGDNLDIKTDKHAFATHHWDEAMWSAESEIIAREVQKYVDKLGDVR